MCGRKERNEWKATARLERRSRVFHCGSADITNQGENTERVCTDRKWANCVCWLLSRWSCSNLQNQGEQSEGFNESFDCVNMPLFTAVSVDSPWLLIVIHFFFRYESDFLFLFFYYTVIGHLAHITKGSFSSRRNHVLFSLIMNQPWTLFHSYLTSLEVLL